MASFKRFNSKKGVLFDFDDTLAKTKFGKIFGLKSASLRNRVIYTLAGARTAICVCILPETIDKLKAPCYTIPTFIPANYARTRHI